RSNAVRRVVVLAGQDRRNMCAVAVVVEWCLRALGDVGAPTLRVEGHEVLEVQDLAGREVLMPGVHARVEDGGGDAGAVHSVSGCGVGDAAAGGRGVERLVRDAVAADVEGSVAGGKFVDLLGSEVSGDGGKHRIAVRGREEQGVGPIAAVEAGDDAEASA